MHFFPIPLLFAVVAAVAVACFCLGLAVRITQVKKLRKELYEVRRELMDAYAECLKVNAS